MFPSSSNASSQMDGTLHEAEGQSCSLYYVDLNKRS
jgi:hypothetical protein